MYLKSRFKCLPSAFLEVAIVTLVWVFPPSLFVSQNMQIILVIFLIIEMLQCSYRAYTIHLTHGNCQCFSGSFWFSEYCIMEIIPHHQTLTDEYLCYFQYFDITNIAKRKILRISFYIFVNFPLG